MPMRAHAKTEVGIMGVMLQAFYWDCPKAEDREYQWWAFIESKLPSIAQAGFTALWLPPANKAASWKSMGYDPYDYYDLGELDQKGGVPTWFGSKTELLDLIEAAHAAGLQVYADLVFNHNSGADAQELNPIDGQSRWTKFEPMRGKFPRDGECWDSERRIDDWLDEANAWSDNPVGAFDFPLRWRLRDLCDTYGFSLRNLTEPGVLMWDRSAQAVTFVENHDVVRDSPIINDKLLAYAFILTHEGYPCVFWQDYFNWDLAQPNTQIGIDALIKVHEQNAAGPTQVLFVNDDLYIMQRPGNANQSGLLFILNNSGSWNGAWIQTRWINTQLVPAAWRGRDDFSMPQEKWTNDSRWVDVWAPPRGYAVYIPE